MSPGRFEQIADLFLRASERPPEARREFLEGACGGDEALRDEVDSMLRDDAQPPALARTGSMLALACSEPPDPPPAFIGSYRIVRALGEGGMGVVYLADQEHPIRRQVAVKLIRPEIQSRQFIARFEFERQALALMNHPNIARVFDAGETTEGRPYLAMEYVTGEPITSYCDARGLGIEERLRLFLEVCAGVAHAHRNAVIHRDLKPSNILVSQDAGTPVPKLIDFGIAKALDHQDCAQTSATEIGQLLGTFEYMSPEQLSGGRQVVDMRTDVYSLGVVLYELLVGDRPFEQAAESGDTLADLCRRIQEQEPERPSTRAARAPNVEAARRRGLVPRALARRLRRDLDAIAQKALAKDPQGRYASPSSMADDVERHLHHRPIHARRPGPLVRLRKVIRRQRAAAAVVTVLSATTIGLAILGTAQAARAQRESARAETEARIGDAVRSFVLSVIDPRLHDAQSRIREGRLADAELLLSGLIAAIERVDRTGAGGFATAPRLALAKCWIRRGRFNEAEDLLLPTLAVVQTDGSVGDKGRTVELLVQCDIGRGRHGSALARITEVDSLLRPGFENVEKHYAAAQRQALGGRYEEALRSLALASEFGFSDFDRLEHDLAFVNLRARAEFRTIARSAHRRTL